MNSSRRTFIARASVAAGAVVLQKGIYPVKLAAIAGGTVNGSTKITIYHTNNLSGNLNPVHKTIGGLRQINVHLNSDKADNLLLDAGTFLNNRRHFESQCDVIDLMNASGYKAAAISGLDFSGEGQHLSALIPRMQFSLVNCNHKFTPALQSSIKPYLTFKSGAIKIGVTGICRPLKGAAYLDAIESANRTARFLKLNEGCHLVVCMSDLGAPAGQNQLSDKNLALSSEHIDLIIGNDRGKLQGNDQVLRNKLKHEVVFLAATAKGLTIGKTVVTFNESRQKQMIDIGQVLPGKPAGKKFAAAVSGLSLV